MINASEEFDRQVVTLLHKDYPKLSGMSEKDFEEKLAPLKIFLDGRTFEEPDLENGKLPFVIVIHEKYIPLGTAMTRVIREGKEGIEKLFPHSPSDFHHTADVSIPDKFAYLILDIDRGKNTLNITPEIALQTIKEQSRSPLTIDEGIAIVTHYPDFLKKNNCFSLLASRVRGNQRVPAIWINGKKHPNLGWCWDRNPHTWLGSASCGDRLG